MTLEEVLRIGFGTRSADALSIDFGSGASVRMWHKMNRDFFATNTAVDGALGLFRAAQDLEQRSVHLMLAELSDSPLADLLRGAAGAGVTMVNLAAGRTSRAGAWNRNSRKYYTGYAADPSEALSAALSGACGGLLV